MLHILSGLILICIILHLYDLAHSWNDFDDDDNDDDVHDDDDDDDA